MRMRRRPHLDVSITVAHIAFVTSVGLGSAALSGLATSDIAAWAVNLAFQGAFLAWFLVGSRRLPIRLLAQVAYYSLAYIVLDAFVPVLHLADGAEELQTVDRFLFGCEPARELHKLFSPLFHDVFAVGYSLFLPYLYFNVGRVLLQDGARSMRRFVVGYAMVYGLGYLGYVLLPASGPRFHDELVAGGASFVDLTDGPPVSAWLSSFMDDYSGHTNVFPSLHAAASLYLLVFEYRFRSKRLALACAPIVFCIWVGTVYQGYHYGVDLLAASCLVVVGFIAVRYSDAPRRASILLESSSSVRG